MKKQYKIYLHYLNGIEGQCPPVRAAWYAGHTCNSNDYLYSRTQNESLAATFTEDEAIREITKMRGHGYGANCVPEIIKNVKY